jgi:hypothetical protein
LTPSERKYHIISAAFLVFVNASEDLVMANDVVTPSNPLIMPIEEEELEKTSFDMNVSQQSRNKNSFRKVVHIRVNCSAWDCRLSLNPHA